MTDSNQLPPGFSILEDLARDQLDFDRDKRVFDRDELDGVLETVERSWNFTRSGELSELQRVLAYIRELHDSLPGELRPEPPDTLTMGVNELAVFFTAALRGVRDAEHARTIAGRMLDLVLDHGGRLRLDGVFQAERRTLVLAMDLLLSHDHEDDEPVRSALAPLRQRFLSAPRASSGE